MGMGLLRFEQDSHRDVKICALRKCIGFSQNLGWENRNRTHPFMTLRFDTVITVDYSTCQVLGRGACIFSSKHELFVCLVEYKTPGKRRFVVLNMKPKRL